MLKQIEYAARFLFLQCSSVHVHCKTARNYEMALEKQSREQFGVSLFLFTFNISNV